MGFGTFDIGGRCQGQKSPDRRVIDRGFKSPRFGGKAFKDTVND